MYPPLPPSGNCEVMLGESLALHIESSLDNVENNKPATFTASHGGTNLNKSRQALFKKGGRRVRAPPSSVQNKNNHILHQKQTGSLRNIPMRLADINNNHTAIKTSTRPPVPSNVDASTNKTSGSVITHFKPGTRKELLKSKSGRGERASQTSAPSAHCLNRHDQSAQNLNVRGQRGKHGNLPGNVPSAKKNDNSGHQSSSPPQLNPKEGKKPLQGSSERGPDAGVPQCEPASEENLKDAEKTYAGAKFSEPPSPSVLPKPPSHWVGEEAPQHSDKSREQMTVHLKSLLKVQVKP